MIEAIENFRTVVTEKRWLQGAWQRQGDDGRHYLCLAAAWGKPGAIKGTEDCPVGLFPKWLFELMPTLDDGVAADDVPWLFQGFADRADAMAKLDSAAWDRIRTGFMIATIRQAVESAKPVQPDPAPEYWQKVVDATEQVIAALQGNGDLEEARAAARAAEAAAWAAEAAEAAEAAWAAAAEATAARAARAAARAARAAAAEAAAAWAAAAEAYRKLAETLFALIDAEISHV